MQQNIAAQNAVYVKIKMKSKKWFFDAQRVTITHVQSCRRLDVAVVQVIGNSGIDLEPDVLRVFGSIKFFGS